MHIDIREGLPIPVSIDYSQVKVQGFADCLPRSQ